MMRKWQQTIVAALVIVACAAMVMPAVVRAAGVPDDVYVTPGSKTDVIVMTVGSRSFKANNVAGSIDAGPQIKWGRTFAPIQPVVKALKGTITWNAKTKVVTIKRGKITIVLTIGNRYATVNGKKVAIDTNAKVVPYLQNGHTMLPVRFIAEKLGGVVKWNASTKGITIAFVKP